MAGAGWRRAWRSRPGAAPGIRSRRTPRAACLAYAGWRSLALVLALFFVGNAQAEVVAARIWPAPEYTRLTLETKEELKYTLFTLKDPERLVLELETDETAGPLADLQAKLTVEDPYIKGLRVARNRPGIVRLVLDLKQTVNAQVFTLKPVGEYGYRLVLDLHPLVPIDPLAQLIEQTQQSQAPQPPKAPGAPVARLATIVIDAGHGGEDPGAIGRRGSREKDITLMIARRLKALIDAEPNMRALLTRDGDYFLPLNVRVDKARQVKADLFVSIHADSFVRKDARGSSVFALSERRATSEMAKLLAKKENESDLIGGVNFKGKDSYVAQTLLDLSQTATIDHSLRLGGSVLKQLGSVNDLHKPRVEQASFAVLKAHDVPSILIETAFISNPQEEKRLTSQPYQDKLARAILAGIKDYVARNPPRPTSPMALN
jgi:N-acetylmuramoyl-L-alanine amidase